MTLRPDGREVPDFDTVGVLAPGGGTQGITRAGQAELTRQRFAHTSLPTRALGVALGAAETLVPAAGSPKETLRTLAKAARDYIVHGTERGFARQAFEQGFDTGGAAAAGDPHAQGAALAAVGGAALVARGALYGRAANALPPRAAVDLTPSPKPLANPLDVPAYQRAAAPVRQRFATDAEVRLHNLRQQYANHTAETILPIRGLADVGQPPQTAAGPGTKYTPLTEVAKRFERPLLDRVAEGEGMPAVRDDAGRIWTQKQPTEHGDLLAWARDNGADFNKPTSGSGWILKNSAGRFNKKDFVHYSELEPPKE